ncbi:MAG: DNA primase [Mariprofundales bacterium]|nr:DNA primase [Mariprofundales bacterium]
MAYFEQEFIESVLQRIDLVSLISRHVQLKRSGANFMGLCPFHNEKTPSFSVSSDKQIFYCFGCGKGGNAFRFAMDHDGYTFPEAVEYLAGVAGVALPAESGDPQDRERRQLRLDILQQAADLFIDALRHHQSARRYLEQRRLSPAVIARYGLGYAPPGYGFLKQHLGSSREQQNRMAAVGLISDAAHGGGDRFRDRIMFPIRDRRGQVVGFGGRLLGEGEPKYLNTAETALFHKSSLLYGYAEHRESIRKEQRMIVVEGYMDVLALASHGLPQGVAPLGTAISEHQLRSTLQLCHTPLFSFDGDSAGRKAAWRALERLMPLLTAEYKPQFLFLPEGEDPDSLLQKEGGDGFLLRMGREAQPALRSWIAGLRHASGGGVEGRARMAKLAYDMLATMGDRYLAQAWQQEVEQSTGIAISPHRGQKSVRQERRARQLPAKRVRERFIKALLQKPERITMLNSGDSAFSLDNDTLQSLYTRAFSVREEYKSEPAGIIRELIATLPESADISRWAMVPEPPPDQDGVDDSVDGDHVSEQEYQAILATLRMEQIQHRLSSGQLSLRESIALQQQLRQLSQQRKAYNS